MPITAASLTSGADTTNASSYATASVAPSANQLVLLAVVNSRATQGNEPTASGAGMTWVNVNAGVQYFSGAGINKVTLFRAMKASPGSGAVTIDFAAQNQTGCAWSIVEFNGVDTSGTDGSGAIVQSNAGNETAATTTLINLAAFGSANNAGYGVVGITVNEAITPGTGETELHDLGYATPAIRLQTEWAINDASLQWDWTTSADAGAIAAEIKAAAAVDLPYQPWRQRGPILAQ